MDKESKQMFELILNKLDGMNQRFDGIDKRQDEMYVLLRGLEENAKVTRAEQEKMMYTIVDIQGKVTKLTEEVQEHDTVIRQIRAIK